MKSKLPKLRDVKVEDKIVNKKVILPDSRHRLDLYYKEFSDIPKSEKQYASYDSVKGIVTKVIAVYENEDKVRVAKVKVGDYTLYFRTSDLKLV